MIVLGERPTWYDAIGFALMLAASAIVVLRPDGATGHSSEPLACAPRTHEVASHHDSRDSAASSAGLRCRGGRHKKLCGSTSTSSLRLPLRFGAFASQSRRYAERSKPRGDFTSSRKR